MTKYYKVDLGIEIKLYPLYEIKEKYLKLEKYPELQYVNKRNAYTNWKTYKNCNYMITANLAKDGHISRWTIDLESKDDIDDKRFNKKTNNVYTLVVDKLVYINNEMFGDENESFKTYHTLVKDIENVIDDNYKPNLNNEESIFNHLCFIYDKIKDYINF